jgi:hypothetical protein
MAWVNALHLALTDQHCVVQRSGPHSRHDLGFTIGPLWRCQVATAVRWGNEPVLSSTIRPRSVVALAALLAVLVVADLSSATTVGQLIGVIIAAAGAELLVVRSRLRRAVAGHHGPEGEEPR